MSAIISLLLLSVLQDDLNTNLLFAGRSMVAFHDIVIDIVMDNAGFELFSDLCLADFLITTGLASMVRLRVKVEMIII